MVSVQTVTNTTAAPTLQIFGQVETPHRSELTAAVEADIIAVNVLEGDAVQLGQLMIVLDDTDSALEIAQRTAELQEIEALLESEKLALQPDQVLLDLAQKSVARARQLFRSQTASEAAVKQSMQQEQRQRLAIALRQRAINGYTPRRSKTLPY